MLFLLLHIGCSQAPPKLGSFCQQDDILKVVQLNKEILLDCYKNELKVTPKISGKVILNWTIGTDGKVLKASVEQSTLKNEGVENCLVELAKKWQFVKPNGGLCHIKFPFVFNYDGENLSDTGGG